MGGLRHLAIPADVWDLSLNGHFVKPRFSYLPAVKVALAQVAACESLRRRCFSLS